MKKTRVATYCRVSRGGAEPEHSLQAQAAYYKEMICAAPSFQFAGIYAEIASGLNIKRRPQFRKLLQDCKKGKVDLILTKSVSRFARNTVDFLNAIRQLRSWGVDVYFESERILLSKERTDITMSIYAAFMQDESIQKSNSIKWGLQAGFASGESKLANRICYGYIALFLKPGQRPADRRVLQRCGNDMLSVVSPGTGDALYRKIVCLAGAGCVDDLGCLDVQKASDRLRCLRKSVFGRRSRGMRRIRVADIILLGSNKYFEYGRIDRRVGGIIQIDHGLPPLRFAEGAKPSEYS